MSREQRAEPLYRKVNTRARGVHHHKGGDYRHQRNSKREQENAADEISRGSMHGSKRRGRDYTPLFRFLLSKVGADWAGVLQEAQGRLDTEAPIYWMVARSVHERRPYICIGESTYFSGLYVDDAGRLAKVAPELRNEDLKPNCACCTHTLNGVVLARKYVPPA